MIHSQSDPLVERLQLAAAALPIVDTHQHLAPEVPLETDLCRLLMDDNYLLTDLTSAGLDVTQIGVLAKAFPNVWLNLAWAHLISTELSLRALREWLDLLPWNKVLGFGGDHGNRTAVFTFGHLLLARRNLTHVLAAAVRDGRMLATDAERLLRAWLVDTPRELYRLPAAL
jgi:hypothetical protein